MTNATALRSLRTVVLGASTNPGRYANIAVRKLHANGHIPLPVGLHPGTIDQIDILLDQPMLEDVHTVTLYMRAELQRTMFDYILGLQPERIIFNPGAENPELEKLARAQGIQPVRACTMVMLATKTF